MVGGSSRQYCEFLSSGERGLVHNIDIVAEPVAVELVITPGGVAIVVGILLVMVVVMLVSLRHRPRGRR